GKGSRTLTKPHPTPSPQAPQSPHHATSSSSHPTASTETIPTETPTEIPTLRQYSKRATRIAQENIVKTSALPHDSTPRVTSLDADEGNMQQKLQELMDLCTGLQRQQTQMATKIKAQDLEISSLKARIKLLEDKNIAELSGDDALIKGRSMEIGEEAGVEKSTKRGSNDTEELVNVLTSMDAANILTSGVQAVSVPPVAEVSTVGVPTGSGLVLTVSAIFTTTSVVTPYSRHPREISAKDKGKEKMVESDTPKKKKLQEQIDVQVAREMEEEIAREDQRLNEQIARDAEIARIHAEEELHMMIDGLDRNNEVIAKHLQEYEQSEAKLTIGEKIELINELVKYQDHHAKILKYQAQQSKPLSKKEQREFYISVLRSHYGWKTKHFRDMTLKEIREKFIPVELKRLFKPDFENQLWTHTQNLMHDPLEWKLYDTCGVHHVFTKDEEIFMLVERDYPLRRGLAIVMISNKLQVENYLQMANDLILRIHNIANRERVKRKGLKLEQRSAKRIKTFEEVSEEDLKEMMQLVHVEEVYVEALQVKHSIIDWEIHSEGKKDYWKIIRLGGNTAVYQFFVDMLKQLDREDLNQLWALVKETLSIRQASTKDKGKEKMVESDTPKKKKLQAQIDVQVAREMEEEIAREDQRLNEQIPKDAEIARIHAEEELHMMIDGLDRNNEVIAKHLQEYEQSEAKLTIGENIE
nr:hypothetical protein [Tanacetum cinerariifolium]